MNQNFLTPRALSAVRNAVGTVLAREEGQDHSWSLPADVTGEEFLAAVARHRVETVLAFGEGLQLPATLQHALETAATSVVVHAEEQWRDIADVLTALEARGIATLVFKGIALAHQTTGSPWSRGVGDLDLLVDPVEVDRARVALEDLGFRAPAAAPPAGSWMWSATKRLYYEVSLSRGGFSVDLHWHLDGRRSQMPSFSTLWADRQALLLAERTIFTLDDATALRHASSHAERDDWRWLRSLVDVRRLSRRAEVTGSVVARAMAVTDTTLGLGEASLPKELARSVEASQRFEPPRQNHLPGSGLWRDLGRQLRGSSGRDWLRGALRLVLKPNVMGSITTPHAPLALAQWSLHRAAGALTQWRRWRGSTTPTLPVELVVTPETVVRRSDLPTPEFNAVGERIWALIETPSTVARVATVLGAEFDVDPAVCTQAVIAFVEQLRRIDAVELIYA